MITQMNSIGASVPALRDSRGRGTVIAGNR
jgi:hypothetical protein